MCIRDRPQALSVWNGRLFTDYPLTLGTLDPAFTLPAPVWAVQLLLLLAGVLLFAGRLGRRARR